MTRTHFARVEEPQIGAFADHHTGAEGEDPGKRDVEIRDDAQRRRLDDMTTKAVEIAGPGAAGVDEGRRSTAPRHFGGIDAERGAAPIDMGVEIDQPGHDEEPAGIDNLTAGEIMPDRGNFPLVEGDIGRFVTPARRIDDATAFEHQIRHFGRPVYLTLSFPPKRL